VVTVYTGAYRVWLLYMVCGAGAMPPKGYRNASLKVEVYERLEALARSRGLSSINDTVVLLLEVYEVCRATQASSQPQGERKPSLADILGLR
jgi:hypothetical protein